MSKILEGNIIKKPHQKREYTQKEIEELKKCLPDNEDGHYYFMTNYCWIQNPEKGSVLFEPFEYQKRLIDNYHRHRLSINMLARQLGKCVQYDSKITLRNKTSGEIQEMSIGDFFYKVIQECDPDYVIDHNND